MSRLTRWLTVGGLATTLTACPARPPALPPPPPPPSVHVPPGCEQDQSGLYHHAENAAFRYRGEEDGGTLTLAVTRIWPESATPSDAGSAVTIVLERTPEGFVGETRATTYTPAGVECPVRFTTQAIACEPGGLTLRSVTSAALDENCAPAPQGPSPEWKEQRLLRGEPDAGPVDAGAPDAGAPDAGTADAGDLDAGAASKR